MDRKGREESDEVLACLSRTNTFLAQSHPYFTTSLASKAQVRTHETIADEIP